MQGDRPRCNPLFTALDEFEASTRCAVSSADDFVGALARPGQFAATAIARQETMMAGGGAQGRALNNIGEWATHPIVPANVTPASDVI